jgi:hypothetical protein
MSDDFQLVLEIVASPSGPSETADFRLAQLTEIYASKYGAFCSDDAAIQLKKYLQQSQWAVLRQWLSQADRVSLEKFLSAKAEVFFREQRKTLMAKAMGGTPWAEIIQYAEHLSPGYRALAQYCLVEGLSGAALKKAVRSDMRCRLETTGAISTSRSNLLLVLRACCRPDHVEMIDAVLRLRQRSGRRPKAPTRSDTSR